MSNTTAGFFRFAPAMSPFRPADRRNSRRPAQSAASPRRRVPEVDLLSPMWLLSWSTRSCRPVVARSSPRRLGIFWRSTVRPIAPSVPLPPRRRSPWWSRGTRFGPAPAPTLLPRPRLVRVGFGEPLRTMARQGAPAPPLPPRPRCLRGMPVVVPPPRPPGTLPTPAAHTTRRRRARGPPRRTGSSRNAKEDKEAAHCLDAWS